MQPLILTLALDAESQAYFDQLRQQHFPPERNFLKAHLTLFHHLPPAEETIVNHIEQVCLQHPLLLQVQAVVNIGRGVAYKIECPPLQQLHAGLQQQWRPWLTPQDAQKLWPHITVQNKVAPATARVLQQSLEQAFAPFDAWGTGLTLWEYQNGPWQWLQDFTFRGH